MEKQHPYTGKKVLVTTQDWFVAPDGKSYKSAHGTLKAIHETKDLLGFIPNRHHANWTIEIGNMTIAGCQVLYTIQVDEVCFGEVLDYSSNEHTGCSNQTASFSAKRFTRPSMIYNADIETVKIGDNTVNHVDEVEPIDWMSESTIEQLHSWLLSFPYEKGWEQYDTYARMLRMFVKHAGKDAMIELMREIFGIDDGSDGNINWLSSDTITQLNKWIRQTLSFGHTSNDIQAARVIHGQLGQFIEEIDQRTTV